MLELIIVILLVLWLFGYFGQTRIKQFPKMGKNVHIILVIILILIVVKILL